MAVAGIAGPLRRIAAGRRRLPTGITTAAALVAAALLLPLAFLCWQAAQVGWGELQHLLARRLTLDLLWNTVRLAVVVTVASALIGTGAAWATERTTLPGRRVWAVLLVLPVAIPDFVIAWGWVSIRPSLSGLPGAALVLTLGLYPLVYLPVAASFRRADPAQEEVARSLGRGPFETFIRVTLRQARLAIAGGCLLVALYLLAEYGAFAILRYQTFTTEIFSEFEQGFNAPAAAALSLVVAVLGMVVLASEGVATRAGRQGTVQARSRAVSRARLGRAAAPVTAAMAVLVGLAVGVPVATIVYWMGSGQRSTLPAASTLAGAAWHTALYSAAAAALATLAAVPVAILAVRHRGRMAIAFERAGLLVEALPGLVIALALVFFTVHYAPVLYQSAPLLVMAYAVMFFPLAFVAVRASLARVPPALEEVGRSLGRRPVSVVVRVVVPLVLPGLLAAFFLVFLTAATELPATLVLVPTGVQTLATQFWAYTGQFSYAAAAPFAAAMLALAVVPTVLLGRWFDRLPTGALSR
ncbi:MAG: iron ABC transporter permease [Acidobacteriota bacterium]|nr:iron ABC transporter permease [Acidobacteriota bacterium]